MQEDLEKGVPWHSFLLRIFHSIIRYNVLQFI